MNNHGEKGILLIGAGGHGKVVLEALLQNPALHVAGILDQDPSKRGQNIMGVPVIGTDEMLGELRQKGIENCAIGIGGSQDNTLRAKIFRLMLKANCLPFTVVHPHSYVSFSAKYGQGCFLACGSRLLADASIGDDGIINSGASVDHDCLIGRHVHVSPNATLCGNVNVGDYAHIGAGSVIRQDIRIGEHAVVGAGAVVVRDVPDYAIVVGNPARLLREKER